MQLPLNWADVEDGSESNISCILRTKSSLLAIFFRYIPIASAATEMDSGFSELDEEPVDQTGMKRKMMLRSIKLRIGSEGPCKAAIFSLNLSYNKLYLS